MKRFKIITILLISLFTAGSSFSQKHPNSLYLEIAGSGGFYSINYERLLSPHFGVKVGFSYVDELILPRFNATFIPVSIICLIGGGSSKLELGAGITFLSSEIRWFGEDVTGNTTMPNLIIGYRYQSEYGGFLFRIGFTPLFSPNIFTPWGGMSVGLSF